MEHGDSGMSAEWPPVTVWQKSRFSSPSGNCVEVAALTDGGVAVRNSRYPGGPALIYTRAEMVAFVQGVKAGEFDKLLGSIQAE